MRTARRLTRALRTSGPIIMVLAVAASLMVALPAAPATAAPATSATSIQKQIDEASDELETIVEEYDKVSTELDTNKTAATKLQAQMAPTLAAMDTARATVARIAAQTYMTGPGSSLTAIVDANGTGDMVDRMSALDEIASTQQRQIAALRSVTAVYDAQKRKLDDLIALQTRQRQSLADQKKTINTKLTKLYALRVAAYGSATTESGGKQPVPPYLPGRGGAVVTFAYKQLGKPYAWAAAGPKSYDCSGLVLAAYKQVGVSLPHNAAMQWGVVHHIPRAELSPGDLVFYDSSHIHHVAIYIGHSQVIHAPTFGDHVKISGIDMMRPWGYGRP